MRIINHTPHALVFFPPSAPDRVRVAEGRFFDLQTGEEISPLLVLPPSGEVWRMEEVDEEGDPLRLDGREIPVTLRLLKVPEPPPEDPDTVHVVSLPLAMAWARILVAPRDIYAPDTGSGAVRDEQGRIVGTRRLIRIVG
jgi:hypothetical protein